MHLCPHVRVPPWVQVMPRPLQQVGIPRQRVMLCRATFRHLCSAGSNKQCGAGQQRGGGVPVPGADGRRCGESGLHDGAMPRVAVPFSSCTGVRMCLSSGRGALSRTCDGKASTPRRTAMASRLHLLGGELAWGEERSRWAFDEDRAACRPRCCFIRYDC